MIYAVYRGLYGEDFIQASIRSIEPYVDKIFVFFDTIPWGNVESVFYQGEWKRFPIPYKFDNYCEKIQELKSPKVILQWDHVENNLGQFTHLVNDLILPFHEKPEILIFMEPDYVWRSDQILWALQEFRASGMKVATSLQVEMWKDLKYCLPPRTRLASMFWKMEGLDKLPETGRHADPLMEFVNRLTAKVHNLGFSASVDTMYIKHLLALGFSQKIGDSPPNEDWYEEKWLKWDFFLNNRNLEISKGYEHLIPFAIAYDPITHGPLPEVLR